jgi:hypothetical protein
VTAKPCSTHQGLKVSACWAAASLSAPASDTKGGQHGSCSGWLLGSRNNPGSSAMMPCVELEQPVCDGLHAAILTYPRGASTALLGAFRY